MELASCGPQGRETHVLFTPIAPTWSGTAKRRADAWVTMRHPRCLLRHAGIGGGSFAAFGRDAGVNAPTGRTGRRS